MFDIVVEALENFCTHQIREPYHIQNEISILRTIIAYIDIKSPSSSDYRVYLGAKHGFAQKVATIMLEEQDSDEETLVDMMLESTNLIVGSAKVLYNDKYNGDYTLGTPIYEKTDNFDIVYDYAKILNIGEDCIIVAIKGI